MPTRSTLEGGEVREERNRTGIIALSIIFFHSPEFGQKKVYFECGAKMSDGKKPHISQRDPTQLFKLIKQIGSGSYGAVHLVRACAVVLLLESDRWVAKERSDCG